MTGGASICKRVGISSKNYIFKRYNLHLCLRQGWHCYPWGFGLPPSVKEWELVLIEKLNIFYKYQYLQFCWRIGVVVGLENCRKLNWGYSLLHLNTLIHTPAKWKHSPTWLHKHHAYLRNEKHSSARPLFQVEKRKNNIFVTHNIYFNYSHIGLLHLQG